MTRFTFLCLLYISTGTAQIIAVGVKGGLPLSQALNAQANNDIPTLSAFLLSRTTQAYDSATQRTVPYTIGPAVEIRLWHQIRAEVDGLYSRAAYDYTSIGFNKFSSTSVFEALKHTVDHVEIPVLVKYRFVEQGKLHPFVGVGASILYSRDRASQGVIDASTPGEPPTPPYLFNPRSGNAVQVVKGGPTFAAGAVISIGRPRISAELRYTRFTGDAISSPALHSNQNEAKLIVGVMF
jgi:hypothetical protein